MIFLRQATASQEVLLGPFLDDTDGKTAETGLTIANTDIKIWKRGGTTEADKNSGGATHIAGGRYYAVLDATDTDTVGELLINVHVSGALPVRLICCVLEEVVFDQLFAASAAGYQVPIWSSASATVNLSATTVATVTTATTAISLPNERSRYMHGAVWINTISGAAGSSSYRNGIMTNPVDGLADAKTIADNLKLKKFYIQNQSSLTLAATYSGYVFEGQEWTLALGGQAIANAVIIGATVSGIATGASPTFAGIATSAR